MTFFYRLLMPVVLVAMLFATPGQGRAGGDFEGVWQPYSRNTQFHGAMTVSRDSLSFAAGSQAGLDPVRAGGSVFRLVDPQGDGFAECGAEPIAFVGFHVLENGLLARLYYWDNGQPKEPTGGNPTEVTRNGACSVEFYAR